MKRPLIPVLVMLVLASCQKKTTVAPCDGLEGTWRLVKHQCYCSPAPLPIETLTLTATTFAFSRVGPQPAPQPALFMSGTYHQDTVKVCGLATARLGLRLTDAVANIGPRDVLYTLQGDTLVLDYGGPCDAPVDTYVRVQP